MKNTGGTEKQVIIPDVKPFIELDEKIKDELLTQFEEQGMVIVHCSFSVPIDIGIRIPLMFIMSILMIRCFKSPFK